MNLKETKFNGQTTKLATLFGSRNWVILKSEDY